MSSHENAEVLRRIQGAWNERDLEGLLSSVHPEFEYVNAPSAVEPGTRRGHEGLAEVVRIQWESIPGAVLELDRIHDRGDRVITEALVSRTMPGSETRISNRVLIAWTFRGGKLVRVENLGGGPEFAAALEAAGLSG